MPAHQSPNPIRTYSIVTILSLIFASTHPRCLHLLQAYTVETLDSFLRKSEKHDMQRGQIDKVDEIRRLYGRYKILVIWEENESRAVVIGRILWFEDVLFLAVAMPKGGEVTCFYCKKEKQVPTAAGVVYGFSEGGKAVMIKFLCNVCKCKEGVHMQAALKRRK